MLTHHPAGLGLGASLVILLLAVAIPACAALGGPGGPQAPPTRAAAPAAEPLYTTAIPGVADSMYDAVVLFTRRLPTTGEAVAFAFTPHEVTTGGNLVGDLSYTGRRASGRVERVFAAISLSAGEGGACGRVAFQLAPVTLDSLGVWAAFPPVSVDVRQAGGPFGGVAAALCRRADRLVALWRDLDAALRSIGPTD